jgi:superfamily II DNA helicase RecQ
MAEDILNKINKKHGWDIVLKDKQFDIIKNLLESKNMLAVLPTGYGKSLPYMLDPLFMDEVSRTEICIIKLHYAI